MDSPRRQHSRPDGASSRVAMPIKKKKKKRKGAAAGAAAGAADGGSARAAAQYLEQWVTQQAEPAGDAVWKFNKNRQTFLLRSWAEREKVSSETFKHLLAYARSLPAACAERTMAHAREVAAASEAAEAKLLEQEASAPAEGGDEAAADADDAAAIDPEAREERRAVLKIQRARSLRLLNALLEATEAPAEAGGS